METPTGSFYIGRGRCGGDLKGGILCFRIRNNLLFYHRLVYVAKYLSNSESSLIKEGFVFLAIRVSTQ